MSDITKHYQRRGSEAHHPSILISLLIYGYATGVYSSRKIEQATYDSLAFRYISGNTHPDHTSLSNFRKNHRSKFESVFVQVLTIATEMKLLKLGNIAIDGSKVKANASKHKALSYGYILKLEAQLKAEVAALTKKVSRAVLKWTTRATKIPPPCWYSGTNSVLLIRWSRHDYRKGIYHDT